MSIKFSSYAETKMQYGELGTGVIVGLIGLLNAGEVGSVQINERVH